MDEFFDDLFEPLGEPDKVSYFKENGYEFKKLEWNSDGKEVVKIIMLSTPGDKPIPLDIQLANAIKLEEYEKAAKIRDMIKANEDKDTNK